MGDEAAKNIIEPAYCEFKPSIFIEIYEKVYCTLGSDDCRRHCDSMPIEAYPYW